MVDTLLSFNLGRLLLVTFIVYLMGMATPLFLLRLVAQDKQDSCFLNAMLWAILATFCLLVLILLLGV